MKKILFITNPVAGRLGSRAALFDVLNEFNKKGYDVTAKITQYRGHATELCARAQADGYDAVVCAGGDGTVCECVTGLLSSNSTLPIGYIPCGSTNDFGTAVGLSMLPDHAAKAITKENPIPIDIGRFNDRYFNYVASFGAFTATSYSVDQHLKNTYGYLAYLIEGIKDLGSIQPHEMTVIADGREFSGRYVFGAVSNSTRVAGILHYDMVDLNDGLFELLLVKEIKSALDVNKIITGAANSDFSSDAFEYVKCSEVKFLMDDPIPWSLDGEKAEGSNIVNISNLHSAIRIFK